MNSVIPKTHLEYYREHQIAPVRYDLTNMAAHLDRRRSLYTKLGLLPLTFKHANVLEVAAGTGHNSLFLASTLPNKLVLLEPNAVGVQHIKQVYANYQGVHTTPEVICQTLEEFDPSEKFDIAICENWLGTSEHEKKLLQKLASYVAEQGILVVTTISPVGFIPNLLRRFFSIYLAPDHLDFEQRTKILCEAFSPHLATMSEMTRSHVDWVQDNMMNPAYFTLCLSMPMVVELLANHFEVVNTSPLFSTDWRWFKSLYGNNKKINEHFLTEYWKNLHNFLDHTENVFIRESEENNQLEKHAVALIKAVAEHENRAFSVKELSISTKSIFIEYEKFLSFIPKEFSKAISGLNEITKFIASPELININNIKNLHYFSHLFGRETGYISFLRK